MYPEIFTIFYSLQRLRFSHPNAVSGNTRHTKNTRVVCPTLKTLHNVLTQWFVVLSFSTFIFVTSSLRFLLLPLLNAMSVYIERFVYSTLFIKLLLIFCVPVTWKHLKAVPTTVRTKLYKFFLFAYETNTADAICCVWSTIAPVYIKTYRLLP